jgi:hypothetical protein
MSVDSGNSSAIPCVGGRLDLKAHPGHQTINVPVAEPSVG